MKTRVAVTGLGVVAPNGSILPEFLTSLKQGRSGISQIELFDTSSLRVHIGAEVKNFPNNVDQMDRVSALALAAVSEAVNNSGVELEEAAVIWGTLSGGAISFEKFLRNGRDDPYLSLKIPAYSTVRWIAQRFKVKGKLITISTACSSSTNAIGYAFDQIRSGRAKLAVTGGSDTMNLATFAGFHALRSLDPECCRPFDKERKGLVVGEGAGALILENLEQAQARGAKIYAEVMGYGLSCDAYHETSPDPEGIGAVLSMKRALEDAGISPDQVSYINAHGTGTLYNDKAETLAIKKLFGKKAYRIPISSTKSMIGHLMGAAGAVEAVATVLAIKHSFLPPTVNYKVPDPECDLDYVPNEPRKGEIEIALSNSFAFGGNNATLVFKRYGQKS